MSQEASIKFRCHRCSAECEWGGESAEFHRIPEAERLCPNCVVFHCLEAAARRLNKNHKRMVRAIAEGRAVDATAAALKGGMAMAEVMFFCEEAFRTVRECASRPLADAFFSQANTTVH